MIPPYRCEAGFLYVPVRAHLFFVLGSFRFFNDLCYWLAGFDVV